MLGWKGRKASPKHEEKEACGYLIPCSVPAIFEVYPERKWYIAWDSVSLEIGGKTP